MCNFTLQGEIEGAYVPTDEDRRDWVDQLTARCFSKLGVWDQDFVSDQNGRAQFTVAQRQEIDRIWKQWKEHC